MTQEKHFPSTSMAQRAASKPGPKTITALLEKVEFPNDYIHTPEGAGQCDENYFAVKYSLEFQAMPQLHNRSEFKPEPTKTTPLHGGPAARKRDAIPLNADQPHIVYFEGLEDASDLSDLYGWVDHFFLISNRLYGLIQELDPDSLACVKVVDRDGILPEPYWACLPRRNLEAVDTSKTDVRVTHQNYGDPGGDPLYVQSIQINRGAVFDPEETNGVHHFWDIDLYKWFWSSELIARAHQVGIKGLLFYRAGMPLKPPLTQLDLEAIYGGA
jgi:hypothetical protein